MKVRKVRKSGKLVQGVGINDADYNVTIGHMVNGKWKITWRCPFYAAWCSMLVRCHSDKYQSKHPTYKDCEVCDEWFTFSNFKAWMEKQNWKGKQLDKDLLKVGNKVYCPECCIFVDRKINMFVTDHGNDRGANMLGVYWDKSRSKFNSKCRSPFTGKQEFIGYFTNELEAHLAWKSRKHELACLLAESEYCTDPRLAEALRTRYAN